MNIEETVLICPRNDEESLMILKLAKKMQLPKIVSTQPHGARLEREKQLAGRIEETNDRAKYLVIVEIPGPEIEQALKDQGYKLTIIDHHRYDDLDRMQPKSSLEQFMELFGITNEQLAGWGFDPRMVEGVAAIDRGFLWELDRSGIVGDEKKQAIAFYKTLTKELGIERREKEEVEAARAWQNREEREGVLIIRSEEDLISIRDAVSFIIAEQFDAPRPVMIIQGKRRMYLQDSDRAKDLYDRFGGFTFGQDKCWGILKEDGDLPSVDEVLGVVVD